MSKLRLRLLAAICLVGSIGTTLATMQEVGPVRHFDVRPGALQELGNVGGNETPVVEFELVNVANSPIHIGGVTAPCGCLSYSLPEHHLGPGERGRLLLKFSTRGMRGSVILRAVVAYRLEDTTDHWALPLSVHVEVESDSDETDAQPQDAEHAKQPASEKSASLPSGQSRIDTRMNIPTAAVLQGDISSFIKLLDEVRVAGATSTNAVDVYAESRRVFAEQPARSRSSPRCASSTTTDSSGPHPRLSFPAIPLLGAVIWLDSETTRQGPPSLAELLDIERRFVALPETLTSGAVTIKVESQERTLGRSVRRHDFFWDGLRWRHDEEWELPWTNFDAMVETPDEMFRRSGRGSRIRTPELRVFATSLDTGRPEILVDTTPRPDDAIHRPLADPRSLGLVAWVFDTAGNHGPTRHFLRSERHSFKIDELMTDDGPVWRVRYEMPGALGEYWLSPQQGNMPVYIAGSAENHSLSATTRWRDYSGSSSEQPVWYPEQVVVRAMSGDVIASQDTILVERASFGVTHNEEVFSVAGLNLSDGTRLMLDGEEAMWSGKRIIPRVERGVISRGVGEQPSRRITATLALALALIGAILLWQSWRTSKA